MQKTNTPNWHPCFFSQEVLLHLRNFLGTGAAVGWFSPSQGGLQLPAFSSGARREEEHSPSPLKVTRAADGSRWLI